MDRDGLDEWSPHALHPPGSMHLRLTLSALEQASADPAIWRRCAVHQAVLISGLSTLVTALAPIRRDLEEMSRPLP
jgi:hypothetical protein